jgi:hypothetical protein
MLYPKQVEYGFKMNDVQFIDGSLVETISDKVVKVANVKGLFKNIFKNK